jgi:hypothetical protein
MCGPDAAPAQLVSARSRTLQSLKYSWMLDLLIEGLRGGGLPE